MQLDPKNFEYYEDFLSQDEAQRYFDLLMKETFWEEDAPILLFGKEYKQPRLLAYYGDLDYSYSGVSHEARTFTNTLEEIKKKIEEKLGEEFNSVLLNLYRDEKDNMGKHSDDERELGPEPTIASLSLGEQRNFIIHNKFDKSKVKISLKSGSLLIMKGDSQKVTAHEVPEEKEKKNPRINLTFRKILR
jgi:alkylated DNA repair dioxygenase AlkB